MTARTVNILSTLFDRQFYDIPLDIWLIAIATAAVAWAVLAFLRGAGLRRLERIAARTTTSIDDALVSMLRRTRWYFLFVVAIAIGARVLPLAAPPAKILHDVLVVVGFLQGAVWGNALLSFWRNRYVEKQADMGSIATLGVIDLFGRLVLWSVLLLLALDNLGFHITALVTTLGISGIAVALAVQNVLGDLLAAVFIVLDKPFLVGDLIAVDQYSGTVEHLGVRTTRVRSSSGEQIVFANGDITRARVRNYKRMLERRVMFATGVHAETPPEKLAQIPGLLEEIVTRQDDVRFDRAQLKSFADQSLEFETVYHLGRSSYGDFMATQGAITLAVYERFGAAGIKLAYIRPAPSP